MLNSKKQQNIGIVQMLVCATLWSVAGIFIKLIPWNAFAVAGWRSLIALVVMAVYLLISRTRVKFSRRAALSGMFMCLTFLAFVGANKLTTSANAIVLQFTCPVFILVFSALLFRERMNRADVFAVCATLAGIALFFFDQLTPGHILGNFVAIGAGMTMSGMYISMGRLSEPERMGAMLFGQIFTAAVGVPFSFFTDAPLTTASVLSILALGVFQLGVAYILYVLSTKRCPPLACCLLGAAEPLLNPLWVFIFDGEAPGVFALCGGVVVIVSVTVWCIHSNRQKAGSEAAS